MNTTVDTNNFDQSQPQTAGISRQRNKSKFENRVGMALGRNTRPGTGHERDRMRSRTPNENSATHVALANKLDGKSVNDAGQEMMATTVAASSR